LAIKGGDRHQWLTSKLYFRNSQAGQQGRGQETEGWKIGRVGRMRFRTNN
jgi:hypothetical protein